ncbi:vacuolar protein sorting-associated protein 32 homolog 2-like isoform X2 [Musa acuminata AAA Group]|uniref:vacuolar protein sorting-associated protein 32 homolog 2-like isoform X2 n=1 Tax=Musa acuminata AAA Group TaxID=214697 RepID=UPI0031D51F21
MFSRLFGKPNEKANDLSTMDKLYETLAMLEKKEQALMKKVAAEIEKAKEFTKANNKRAAIQCLKRKRLHEQQVEQLGNFQLRIHDQIIMLEGAKATTETIDALRIGAAAMKTIQKETMNWKQNLKNWRVLSWRKNCLNQLQLHLLHQSRILLLNFPLSLCHTKIHLKKMNLQHSNLRWPCSEA